MERRISRAAAAFAALATSGSAFAQGPAPGAPLQPTEPGPVVTRDVITYEASMPNGALIGSGLTMFGISYIPAVIVAAASDRPGDKPLYIPVAGPWIDLASRDRYRSYGRGVGDAPNKALLVVDGVFQGIGALQVLGGFVFPTTRTVTRTASVRVVPSVSGHEVGLLAVGRF